MNVKKSMTLTGIALAVAAGGNSHEAMAGIDAGGSPHEEVQGFVTKRTSLIDFEIDGIAARMDWNTSFWKGSFFGLSLNRKVEVEGRFNSNGVLIADIIEYEQWADMTESGRVESIFGDQLIVDGNVISVTAETTYIGDSDAEERRFNIDDVGAGDLVEVRGFLSDSGYVVATRLERNDADDDNGNDEGDEYDDDD